MAQWLHAAEKAQISFCCLSLIFNWTKKDCKDGSVFNALRPLGNESEQTEARMQISLGKTNCAAFVPTEFWLNIPQRDPCFRWLRKGKKRLTQYCSLHNRVTDLTQEKWKATEWARRHDETQTDEQSWGRIHLSRRLAGGVGLYANV